VKDRSTAGQVRHPSDAEQRRARNNGLYGRAQARSFDALCAPTVGNRAFDIHPPASSYAIRSTAGKTLDPAGHWIRA
jgi:hypothetical protein